MATITSSEIKNATFGYVARRGYRPEQVDLILDRAAETIDTLTKENAILSEKLRALQSQVDELRARESSLNEIMIRAQKMSDDMIAEATVKSNNMVADAERKSEELLSSARSLGESKINEYKESIALEKAKLAEAREEAAGFIDMIVGELTTQTEMIAKIKTRAHIEDVKGVVYQAPAAVEEPAPEPEPEITAAPEAPAAEPEPAPAPVFETAAPAQAEEAPLTFDSIPDVKPYEPVSQAAAPAEPENSAAVSSVADQIAGRILQNAPASSPAPSPAPSSSPASAGMSWDEIIGLKTGSNPTPKTETPDASSLKFGKEFDVTIH